MKRLIREPLVHFLAAGALLFGVYAWLDGGGDDRRVVRLTAQEIGWLKEVWSRRWQRQPSDQEARGIVADYLREKLLAREAREMGLDENDTVIRRRLAQKMEFLVRDTAVLAEPDDDVLRRVYDQNRARYVTPTLVSFTQIHFKSRANAERGLRELVTRPPAQIGEPSLLERDHVLVDMGTVANRLGTKFAEEVFALESGQWQGPVQSAYGFHLVRVNERRTPVQRPFEEVRAQVLDEWRREQTARAKKLYFAGLLEKYDLVVDESIKPLIAVSAEVTP